MKPALFAAAVLVIVGCNSAPLTQPSVLAQESPAYGFADGAGLYQSGRFTVLKGTHGASYGPVVIQAQPLMLGSLDGSGTRYVCVNGNNEVFASTTPCVSPKP